MSNKSKELKHLFYASNFIALSNYLTIIKEKNLNLSNCIFYSPRKIQSTIHIKKEINFIEIENIQLTKSRKYFLNNRLKIHSFVKKINELLNNTFYHLYIPHLINYREKLLLLNKKCQKYSFVEEGLPAYRIDFKIETNSNILSLKYSNIHESMPLGINFKKFAGAYGTNDHAFHWMPKKKKIKLNFNHDAFENFNLSDKYQNILGLDSPHTFDDFSVYLNCIQYFVENQFLKKHETLYLKFHPDYENKTSKKSEIIEILNNQNLNYEILDNNILVERYVQKNHNITFYNINSTLIIYVLLAGGEVIQFGHKFKKSDRKLEYSINLIQSTLKQMKLNLTEIH